VKEASVVERVTSGNRGARSRDLLSPKLIIGAVITVLALVLIFQNTTTGLLLARRSRARARA
jgi:hypothetical protein